MYFFKREREGEKEKRGEGRESEELDYSAFLVPTQLLCDKNIFFKKIYRESVE